MKNKILEVLDNEKDALSLIEINDLIGLETAEELKELSEELVKLEEENILYITKKDKSTNEEDIKTVSKNLQFYKPDYVYLVPAFAEVFYAI